MNDFELELFKNEIVSNSNSSKPSQALNLLIHSLYLTERGRRNSVNVKSLPNTPKGPRTVFTTLHFLGNL